MSSEQRRQSRPPRSTGAGLSPEDIGRIAFADSRGDLDRNEEVQGAEQARIPEPEPAAHTAPVEERRPPVSMPEPAPSGRMPSRIESNYSRTSISRPSAARPATKTIRMQPEEAFRLESICRVLDMSENKLLNEIVEPVLYELDELLRREGRIGVFRYLEALGARRPRS